MSTQSANPQDSLQRMVRRVCKICGNFDAEHHEPDYLEIPPRCVCDWRTWDYDNETALPPACSEYKGDGKENCQTCEHDQACHAPNAAGAIIVTADSPNGAGERNGAKNQDA